jgi:hypothetical protein
LYIPGVNQTIPLMKKSSKEWLAVTGEYDVVKSGSGLAGPKPENRFDADVLAVDIDFANITEPYPLGNETFEETVGAYVPLTGPLVPLVINKIEPVSKLPVNSMVKLELEQSTNVQLWANPNGTGEIKLPKKYRQSELPVTIHVEPKKESLAPKDLVFKVGCKFNKMASAQGGMKEVEAIDRVAMTVLKVNIAEFDRVAPIKTNHVVITTSPSPLPPECSISLACETDTGTTGSATVSPATINQTTTVIITGGIQSWGSGNNAAKDNIKLRAKLGSFVLDEEAFTVCAHPNAVENGPNHNPIDTSSDAGMQIDITVKSETGTDSDLDKVDDSEQVSLSFVHVGSMVGVAPLASSQSGFMPATTVPPDRHAWDKAFIIDRYVNHGGAGSMKKHQLDIFKCKRCGMVNPEVIPSSGYAISRSYFGSGGTRIQLETKKQAEGCSVNGYTTGAGPSATYSETVTVRN